MKLDDTVGRWVGCGGDRLLSRGWLPRSNKTPTHVSLSDMCTSSCTMGRAQAEALDLCIYTYVGKLAHWIAGHPY